MKNMEQQFSEDLSITKSSNSVREYSEPIPVDLLTDILSRVPTKSIGRFLCVSKLWESILSRPDFTELFLTKSHPRLFFTLEVFKDLLVVFSSPQPQNPNDNSSLVATRYKSFPQYFPTEIFEIRNTVGGLVFLRSWTRKKARVICNPTTGESITLPKVKATGVGDSYLGFDPISKQFKVLCMTWSRYGTPNTHRVLTLKTGKRLWRTIQDPLLPHYSRCDGICINGVLYYQANFERSYKIVCFDFRFEKFSLINIDDDDMKSAGYRLTLFNYKGKLGAYRYIGHPRSGNKELALWVLQDAGKHIWSKRICQPPNSANDYKIVGMTRTGEIVFSPYRLSNPFYIFYYNLDGGTFTRVNIQGFEEFKDYDPLIHTSLDFVERVKFM